MKRSSRQKTVEQDTLSSQTYRRDCWRAPLSGVVEAGWITFGLLIAIRVYEAPDTVKAILSAAGFIGLLFNPLSVVLVARFNGYPTKALSVFLFAAAACLLLAALGTNLVLFTSFFILAHILHNQQSPFTTHIYTHNYKREERGTKVSTAFMFISIGGILASQAGGWMLDRDLQLYPVYLIGMALALMGVGWIFRPLPCPPLSSAHIASPWSNLGLLWQDKLFGWLLLCWMLMGLGNLITIPLRVEIMANPDYAINATNGEIALITFVVPATMRILSSRIWGTLFDRIHLITWRLAINTCFVLGFIIFFYAETLLVMGIGTAFLGLAMGGGMLAWNLWVTRIAPAEKVSAYMSVHTALTGVRGVLAPFLGYLMLAHLTPITVAWICSALIIIASIGFILARKSSRLVEE